MGQYSQWLHYQVVDRRLRAELEALEAELAQLQDTLQLLERATPQADNVIIRALASNLNGKISFSNSTADTVETTDEQPSSSLPDTASTMPPEPGNATISPALLNWSKLPDFSPQETAQPFPSLNNPIPSTPSTLHPEIALLPEDMVAFFEEHSQTEPQLELPWWLHNIAAAALANANSAQGTTEQPIDPESIRTNRLVQRWIERWGRQLPPNSTPPYESSSPSRLKPEEGEQSHA